MDLFSSHLGEFAFWANFIYWPIFALAIWRAPWSILKQKDSSNILFATCAVIFLFWHLKVEVSEGLSIHLLGSTILTLMFRWQVAVMANALIVLGITIETGEYSAYAMNGLLTGVWPIMLSYLMWRLNERLLPANYFIYIFFAAFLAAGLSMISAGILSWQLLHHSATLLSEEILEQYLLIFIPIMYPEAFITGGVISIFVVYKPEWIATFDDRRYLDNR